MCGQNNVHDRNRGVGRVVRQLAGHTTRPIFLDPEDESRANRAGGATGQVSLATDYGAVLKIGRFFSSGFTASRDEYHMW